MKEIFTDKPFTFILGAQKTGTTSLHDFLLNHQDISVPSIKETHFFSNTSLYKKGLDWYLEHFDLNKKVMCEVDPSYLFFPKCNKRINDKIDSPRFIVIFRRPLERAFSHYLMSVYRGYEDLPFSDALHKEQERLNSRQKEFSLIHHSYLARGNYVKQLEEFYSLFDRSQFMYIKFDDLIDSQKNQDLLTSICRFMDVDDRLIHNTITKSNTKKKIKSKMIRDLMYKESLFKDAINKIISSDRWRNKIKDTINTLNSKSYEYQESSIEVKNNINSLPQKYITWSNSQTKELAKISKLDLNNWIYG